MLLGIEIGGTKLQLGVGTGERAELAALQRLAVDPSRGAGRIREQIREAAAPLIESRRVRAIGIGFGGPVDLAGGRAIKSHQVEGWDNFPLADWCRDALGLPAVVANDSDCAGLAEARFGAGRGHRVVFYTNVGSGIGGALVIEGAIYRGGLGVASELGHLRPGPEAKQADQTVEAIASGWGIAATARRLMSPESPAGADTGHRADPAITDLLAQCGGGPVEVTGRLVAEAAGRGNTIARQVIVAALETYGWAVAQMITLVAPNVVAVGGGVSQLGEQLFFAPLREYVARYVFPPLRGSYQILRAELGQEVVIHGALALAHDLSLR